jgi:hypothetical protein
MTHPRNVGWGEIGLDYHYDNSPREVQREVFTRQLRHAVRLGKPITVHTREADEDTESILKAEVPKDHKVRHVVPGAGPNDPLTPTPRYTSIVSLTPQILHNAYWNISQTYTQASPARPSSISL